MFRAMSADIISHNISRILTGCGNIQLNLTKSYAIMIVTCGVRLWLILIPSYAIRLLLDYLALYLCTLTPGSPLSLSLIIDRQPMVSCPPLSLTLFLFLFLYLSLSLSLSCLSISLSHTPSLSFVFFDKAHNPGRRVPVVALL